MSQDLPTIGPSVTLRGLDSARRRRAALYMADAAFDGHPDLPREVDQLAALAEVLEVLGYRTRNQASRERPLAEVAAAQPRRRGSVRGAAGAAAEFNVNRDEGALTQRLPAERRVSLGCGDDRGGERGYRRHLAAYQTPCGECLRWRTDQLAERWQRLGVNPESEVVIPT